MSRFRVFSLSRKHGYRRVSQNAFQSEQQEPDDGSSILTITDYRQFLQDQFNSQSVFHNNSKFWLTVFKLATANLVATYAWYATVAIIPMAVNAPLTNGLCIVFIFTLSVRFVREQVTTQKLVAVLLCLLGTTLVGIGNSQTIVYAATNSTFVTNTTTAAATSANELDSNSLSAQMLTQGSAAVGFTLAAICSVAWSLYAVVWGRDVGHPNAYGILLVQSCMGLVVVGLGWMPLPLLWSFDVEPVPELLTAEVAQFVVLDSLFGVNFHLLYALGMSITSPVYISLTGLLSIPVASLADYLLHGEALTAVALLGTLTVCAGVLVMNLVEATAQSFQPSGKSDSLSRNDLDATESLVQLDPATEHALVGVHVACGRGGEIWRLQAVEADEEEMTAQPPKITPQEAFARVVEDSRVPIDSDAHSLLAAIDDD